MSEATLKAIHDAVQAHYTEMNGDGAILTDWFVAYGGMQHDLDADDGISYPSGYTTSNSSPYAVLGVAHMGIGNLNDDLAYPTDDD